MSESLVLQHNHDLQPLHSFHLAACAQHYLRLSAQSQLAQLAELVAKWQLSAQASSTAPIILGGGFNSIFSGNIPNLIIHNQLRGLQIIDSDAKYTWLEVAAGENWHQFTEHCITAGLGGIENLVLIPGNVGAAPVQNIGAYGMELADTLEYVTVYDWFDKKIRRLKASDCEFGYRDSIFKQPAQAQRYLILSITLRLTKQPQLITNYASVTQQLDAKQLDTPTLKDVSNVIKEIRRAKLPDPAHQPNAGSFFKNPIISNTKLASLQQDYPDIPQHRIDAQHTKLYAGWLIEQCDFKGVRFKNLGCHAHQALVIINYGHASGQELSDFIYKIQQRVQERFGVKLEPEVRLYLQTET